MAKMEFNEIVTRIEAWADRHRKLDAQHQALVALTDASPECPLMAPIWDIWAAYTVAVSELIGDKNEWLQWYQYECQMGRHPMEVVSLGGKSITVKTLRQLARVIAY